LSLNIYREYDIRGIFDKELNEDRVKKIGFFLSKRINGEFVAVGFDARVHSEQLFKWLKDGLNRGGKTVLNMGMVPTPVNYFSNYLKLRELTDNKIDSDDYISASVMITGSHNPSEYNGFKITLNKAPFFGKEIYKLGFDVEIILFQPSQKRIER